MSTARKPWEFSLGPADVKPLYLPVRTMSLSEMDVPPNSYYRFTVGSILALSHALGVSHTDLHSEHVPFNELTGLPVFIDTQVRFRELSPSAAVGDFATPFLSFSPEDFHAILAGYINGVYATFPRSDEYVDEFLHRVGVKSTFNPKPRPFSIDVDWMLTSIGRHLEFSEHTLRLVKRSNQVSKEIWAHSEDLCAVVSALLMIGVDCTSIAELSIPKGASERDRSISTSLRNAFKGPRQPISNDMMPLETQFITSFFDSIGEQRSQKSTLDGPEMVQTFFNTLKKFPISSLVSFVDKIVDVCDFIAVFADDATELSEKRQQLSLSAGQLSCMLLAYPAKDLRVDEIRCNTLIQRHNWLVCIRELFRDFKDPMTALQRGAYANSRARTFLEIFERSCGTEERNSLNSLRWRSLALNRQGLQLMNRLAKRLADVSAEHRRSVARISATFAGRINKSWLVISPLRILSAGSELQQLILQELEWAKAFYEQIQTTGIENPTSLEMMEGRCALYASDSFRLDYSRQDIRNLWR